jgi:drug/metabolite transporter (DMT)-like permease
MQFPDTALMAIALALVAGLSWTAGRVLGRADRPLVLVLAVAVVIALASLLLRLVGSPATTSFDSAEFAAFLVVLGCFLAMLGWSSVPVRGAKRS